MVANRTNYVRLYTWLVLAALLLTPSLPTPEGVPSIRLDDVLLVLFPVACLLGGRRFDVDARLLILALITLSFQISILAGTLLGFPSSLGDQFYLIRIAKYTGAVVLASMLIAQLGRVEAVRFFAKSSLVVGLGTAAIAIQQFFDLGSLNSAYVFFVSPTDGYKLVGGYAWPRPVGMVGNPNELGFVFILLGLTGLIGGLIDRTLSGRWQLVSLVMFLCATLTLSRGAVISGVGAFLFLCGSVSLISFAFTDGGLKFRKHGFKVVALSAVLIAGLVAWLIIDQVAAPQITWRFQPGTYGSFEARFDAWEANTNAWRESVAVGVGPLRHAGMFPAADNEHLLLLRTGGVLLYALVMSLLVIGFFSRGVDRYSRSGTLAIAVASLLYMIPAAAFYSIVIFPFMLMFLVVLGPLRVASFSAFPSGNK